VCRATVQMDSFYAHTVTFVELPLAHMLLPGDYSIQFAIEDSGQGARATATLPFAVEAPAQDVPGAGAVPGLTEVSQRAGGQVPVLLVVALVAAGLALGAAIMFVARRRPPIGEVG
ncbi:MAG: hypothetical protein QOI85_2468, partial [Chloroflexota bacterium]|nr:hypothetical protein [Chloroflexota bacterium]